MHRPSIHDRRPLMDVASGRLAADLLLTDALVLNVFTRELLERDVAIHQGRVAAVLPRGCGLQAARTESLGGRTVIPGLIDPHVHVESSMVTVREFAHAVVPRGVTTVAMDPHELGNVLGQRGIRAMLDESRHVALRVLLRVPGRIPAMPEALETAGARLDLEQTEDMLDWPEAVCLAGDINPGLVLRQDDEQMAKTGMAMARGMTVSGQSPGLTGAALCAYVAGGPEDSHVALNVEEVLENQRQGLRSVLTIRPGRRLDRPHFRELARRIREEGLDPRYLQFCTDDVFPHLLEDEGHMDHRVRMAIEEGFDAAVAVQMATINAAEGLRIDRDYGSVSPGKHADLLVMDDLASFRIGAVMIAGRWVVQGGRYDAPPIAYRYPDWATRTMHVSRPLAQDDLALRLAAPGSALASAEVVALHTMVPKERRNYTLPVRDGVVMPDPALGVSCLAVVDRHSGSNRAGKGFVSGIHLQRGAIATTVSHDAHNLMVIGASHADMVVAANRAVANGGGYVLVLDGEVILEIALPVAGLMSEEPFPVVAQMARDVEAALIDRLGCSPLSQILMRLTHLSLPNIPNFGFTDRGMISTHDMRPLASVCACD